MGFLDRLFTVIKANLNALLEKFEDPEKVAEQALREMNELYRESKNSLANALAELKRLEKKYNEAVALVNKWQERAMQAVQAGKEDLARQALLKKKQYEETARHYAANIEKQKAVIEKLKQGLKELEMKIEEAKTKKEIIVARQKTAEAQLKLKEDLARLNDKSVFEMMDKMEEKVNKLEAKAEAADEMIALEEELNGSNIDKEFEKLNTLSVDDELAALKAQVSKGSIEDKTK